MLIILLLLVLVPLAEIAAFIVIGEAIGLWLTLLTVVATALAGSVLLRQQGLMTAQRARMELAQNRMPMRSLFDGLCLFAAGLLLLTPGFITDLVGFVLFIPSVRRLLADRLVQHLERRGNVNITLSGEWTAASNSNDDSLSSGTSSSSEERRDGGSPTSGPHLPPDPDMPPPSSSRWGHRDNDPK